MAVSATSTASKSCSTTVFISHSREATAAMLGHLLALLSWRSRTSSSGSGISSSSRARSAATMLAWPNASVSTASKYCHRPL